MTPLSRVHERVLAACERAGREPATVALVAVTKTRSADAVRALLDESRRSGIAVHALGENRVQEALEKIPLLADAAPTWHFIGRIQTNKAKYLAGRFALVHSLDRRDLVDALGRRCPDVPVLLEVNVSGEPAKAGCDPRETPRLLHAALDAGLDVRGLMTMPPMGDLVAARACFRRLAQHRDHLCASEGVALEELSMGMTDDFEVGIEEGATLIRVGRALFGPREAADAARNEA